MTKIAQTTNKFAFLSKFVFLILAGFMFANLTSAVSAEAKTAQQCYQEGKAAGLHWGYKDGFRGAYKASYNDTISGIGTMDATSQECHTRYKAGFHTGYESGYKRGTREGASKGKEDATQWKADLREQMRECMQTGYNCP